MTKDGSNLCNFYGKLDFWICFIRFFLFFFLFFFVVFFFFFFFFFFLCFSSDVKLLMFHKKYCENFRNFE